jgi:DNA-binding IclR family transcriptional regulator
LDAIRRRGWATAPEEVVLGLNAVAAPIFNELGQCIAALAIVGSIQFIRKDPDPRQASGVVKAAARVSQDLGFSPIRQSRRGMPT